MNVCVCGQCRACCGQCRARSVRAAVRSASDGRRRAAPSSRRLFHTAKFLDTALMQVRSVIATEGFYTFYDAQASALATAAGRRRQRRRRAHEKNQRKCVMSGVEGALSTRTPRPRWPRRPPGRRAAARRRRRAAGTAGRPQVRSERCLSKLSSKRLKRNVEGDRAPRR